jgi:hypothetical protein
VIISGLRHVTAIGGIMTTPTLSRPHDRTAPAAPGVTARRLRRPSWRDPRLLVGLLLVLLSVVGVAGLLRAVASERPNGMAQS